MTSGDKVKLTPNLTGLNVLQMVHGPWATKNGNIKQAKHQATR
jgi:hypothetical protein